jgi:hypothetical protein
MTTDSVLWPSNDYEDADICFLIGRMANAKKEVAGTIENDWYFPTQFCEI